MPKPLEGFGELADRLRAPRQSLREVCRAYLNFATERPALYQAMFVLPTQLEFASPTTPAPLRAGFDGFVQALPPGTERPELVAEVVWSALHGIATLSADGRIRPQDQDERLDILLARIAPTPNGPATP